MSIEYQITRVARRKARKPAARRSYDMRTRAETAAQTRTRILQAAHSLLDRGDGTQLTLREVAAAAGVTRATVYKSVGSRPELLAAVFEDQGRLIGYTRVRAASALPDPAQAVVETVRESCRAWSRMPQAIRKTLALAVLDAEVGEVVARYERYRKGEMLHLARRAHEGGVLATGVTVKYAAAVLTFLTSFAAFDVLREDVGVRLATEHLVRCARAALGIGQSAEI